MKDLIERQAAIDAVLGACKDTATTECAVRELEELPQEGQRWILCAEKMPDIDEDGYSDKVLVCFDKHNLIDICEYRADRRGCGKWYVGDLDDSPEDIGLEVVAWMPLPKPYMEVTE